MARSLNIGFRKKEIERIEAENQAFAKRLFSKQSELVSATLAEEYQAHLRFKKQLKKVEAPPLPEPHKVIVRRTKRRSHT
jgi:hypothetical protein